MGVEGSESREQLLINWDLAFRLMRLRAKVLSRLNPDDSFIQRNALQGNRSISWRRNLIIEANNRILNNSVLSVASSVSADSSSVVMSNVER